MMVFWIVFLGAGSFFKDSNNVVVAASTERSASSRTTTSSAFSTDEQIFLDVPTAESAKNHLKFITSQPHVAGTVGDDVMADFVIESFEDAGIPQVDKFDLQVLLNYPVSQPQLILWKNDDNDDDGARTPLFNASLTEDLLDDTSDTYWRNHTFHGYSPSGHIKGAPLIYANYGTPRDFDLLEQAGIVVNQTVVLIRYGMCFRGLKVRNAQQRGAVAVLIYSDPADDGYGKGDVYPNDGAWRPASGVQRGSVQFISQCAGDPLRADPRYDDLNQTFQSICGVNSRNDLIPSIPSLPISYRDATPLLQNMGGPLAKDIGGSEFVGGIHNLTYRVGPSTLENIMVEVKVGNKEEIKQIPNVVGVIPGTLPPSQDMPVLLGNHRDAWVYGAADPNSGTAALIEVAKGLGTLYTQHHWRPLRSIYLLSWSGEEYGLLGSTGWAELNAPLLKRALVYLNVDTAVSGNHLQCSASPSLTTLWKQVVREMAPTGESGTSLSTTSKTHEQEPNILNPYAMTFGNGPMGDLIDANTNWKWRKTLSVDDNGQVVEEKDAPQIGILGSGSDYTVFLDNLGIPSLDFRFLPKDVGGYGQYHSIYDSFAWMDKFGGIEGQPGSSFDIMAFSARIWGLLAMRLATSPIVLLDHVAQGVALEQYVTALEQQQDVIVHHLDVTSLKKAITLYQEHAAALQLHCFPDPNEEDVTASDADATTNANPLPPKTISEDRAKICNDKLGMTERFFLYGDGLPGRKWFKHILQAPGMDLGYAAEAFPGVQQAVNDGNFQLAQTQVTIATERVEAAANQLKI